MTSVATYFLFLWGEMNQPNARDMLNDIIKSYDRSVGILVNQ